MLIIAIILLGMIAGFVARWIVTSFSKADFSLAEAFGTDTIALSGGCFQNVLLLRMMTEQLAGFRLCLPGDVPANDGGLAFGQALVALAQMESD